MNPNLERTKAGRSHADVMRECEEHALSHASLIAEVTALRASLADAVEMVESLRSERDKLRAALDIMVRTFNVDAIDPLVAFASIEQARAALERSA